MKYAGIGSRETPQDILDKMTYIAKILNEKGYILRSGGAKGADTAFEIGAGENKEIFYSKDATKDSIELALKFHPNPEALKKKGDYALGLMGRNMLIISGQNLDDDVDFVVCWTKDGLPLGGTGQALRYCESKGIEVYNLFFPEVEKELLEMTNRASVENDEDIQNVIQYIQEKNIKEVDYEDKVLYVGDYVVDVKYGEDKLLFELDKVFNQSPDELLRDDDSEENLLIIQGRYLTNYDIYDKSSVNDLKKLWKTNNKIKLIYDIETYKNCFTITMISNCGNFRWIYEISFRKNDSDELFQVLDLANEYQIPMVGFNNLGFDYPVIHWMMRNRKKASIAYNIYLYAQEVIDSYKTSKFGKTVQKRFILIPQIDLYSINHFDNKAKATSLKMIAFNMGFENLQELPYSPHEDLTSEQIDDILRYNINDVLVTLRFYNECLEAMRLRAELSENYGIDFTNMNDTKIGSEIFIQEIEKVKPNSCYTFKNGKREICQTNRPFIQIKNIIFPYIKFERPEFQAILEWLRNQTITETKGVFSNILESDLGDVAKYCDLVTKKSKKMNYYPSEEEIIRFKHDYPMGWVEDLTPEQKYNKKGEPLKTPEPRVFFCWKVAENLHVNINGHKYVFGVGGLHSSVDPSIVESNDEFVIIDEDVASFYPNLAIKNEIYPQHLGIQFCKTYLDIYNQRKASPKGSALNGALKLALNGTYGKSNDKFSPFYDPQYTMAITINGQLSLCMLIEQILKLEGASSVQSNTDGITVRVKRSDSEKVNEIIKEWEDITKLEMERNDYSKMFIRDVNSYLSIYAESGKAKLKGAYEYEMIHHKDNSARVVKMAVEAFLVKGIPLEEFITKHENKLDFMLRTKVPRSSRLISIDNEGIEYEEQNITRFYVSNSEDARSLVKVMPPAEGKTEDRRIGICVGKKVKVCNNLVDFDNSIDYDYYIEEAKKLADVFNKVELEDEI